MFNKNLNSGFLEKTQTQTLENILEINRKTSLLLSSARLRCHRRSAAQGIQLQTKQDVKS